MCNWEFLQNFSGNLNFTFICECLRYLFNSLFQLIISNLFLPFHFFRSLSLISILWTYVQCPKSITSDYQYFPLFFLNNLNILMHQTAKFFSQVFEQTFVSLGAKTLWTISTPIHKAAKNSTNLGLPKFELKLETKVKWK